MAVAANPKILVAVHGIGDQIGYATVQSVAGRVATYLGVAPALPLGRFYSATSVAAGIPKPAPRLMTAPPDPQELVGFGFGEVYWAGIAREPVEAKYVLEEAKNWARTISGRVAVRTARTAAGGVLPPREQRRMVTVVDELVEAIFVLERLSLIAEKAGLFRFDLRKLLVNFIGDVQLVADFGAYRQSILDEFRRVMNSAVDLGGNRPVDLYLVAHSEGTVLTFLALLGALANPQKHRWVASVKGLMTIGAPIEIHHILWPELWRLGSPGAPALRPADGLTVSIPWHNYYDYGDPIAYELDSTAAWLEETGFARHLRPETFAFSRSHLPGKAHTDYWQDDELFGHFIETVVVPPASGTPPKFASPPATRATAVFLSYLLPNLLVAALLMTGTYLFYRPVSHVLEPQGLPGSTVLRDVLGIGLLLTGVTFAGRLPRLTDSRYWWIVSAFLLIASMGLYANLTCFDSRWAIGRVFVRLGDAVGAWPVELPVAARCVSDEPSTVLAEVHAATVGTLLVTAILAVVSGIAASWSAYWGVRIIPVIGALTASGLIAFLLWQTSTQQGARIELWPVVIGAALFFYFWWLATLLFDLVFIWQRYVRHSVVRRRLSELATEGYKPTRVEAFMSRTTPR